MFTRVRPQLTSSSRHAPEADSWTRNATDERVEDMQQLADHSGAVKRLSALQRLADDYVAAGGGRSSQPTGQSAFGMSGILTKSRVGAAGSALEREADRVASEITGQRAPTRDEIGASMGSAGSGAGGGRGVSPLPAALRGQFESRLGVDLDAVRLHSDARADAMAGQLGAAAFTHRSDIYFARDAYQPDSPRGRWLLGHELTHVAQQSGAAAPGLSSAPASTVQCYFILPKSEHESTGVAKHESTTFPGHESDDAHPDFIDPDTKAIHRVVKDEVPDLKVADDGQMAVEHAADTREVESFFATNGVIDAANKKLKSARSEFTLKKALAGALTVPKLGSTDRTALTKVEAQKATYSPRKYFPSMSGTDVGPDLWAKEQCIQLAEQVMGGPKGVKLHGTKDVQFNDLLHDLGMKKYLAAYIDARKNRHRSVKNAKRDAKLAMASLEVPVSKDFETFWDSEYLELHFASKDNAEKFVDVTTELNKKSEHKVFELSGGKGGIEKVTEEDWILRMSIASEVHKDSYEPHLENPLIASWKVSMSFPRSKGIDMEAYEKAMEDLYAGVDEILSANPDLLAETERQLGMNEFADPDVAQAFQIFHLGDGSEESFPYHFAGVVAKSGKDVVTFENYARTDHMGDLDQRMYFQMYGPQRDVSFVEGAPTAKTGGSVDEADMKKGSFHGRWKGIFKSGQTVVRGK